MKTCYLLQSWFWRYKKKNDSKISPFLPVPSGPSRCDMDRFKLPSVCFVAKCVTVQCGAKPVSVKGLYHEVSSLAIANLTVYPHTQHDSNKWRLKGQRCLSEKQHECMNCIGFFQDPSGGSLAFFWGEKPMSLLPTSKNEVVTGSKSVDIHIIDSWNHIPKKLLQMCLSSILRIAWIMENSLITSLLAWGFAKLDRHSSRHCRSNDKTGVIPEPPANALALRWEVYVECRLDTPLWWFGICFQGKFFFLLKSFNVFMVKTPILSPMEILKKTKQHK